MFLPPDEPEQVPPESARSRADLQAELRSQQKKENRHRHRWRRRALYGLSFVVLLGVLASGGLYVYARYRFDQIKKVHAKHLVSAPAARNQPFNVLLVGSDTRAFVNNETPPRSTPSATRPTPGASAAT